MSKFQNKNQRQQADFIKILKNSCPETLSEVGGAPPHYELPPRVDTEPRNSRARLLQLAPRLLQLSLIHTPRYIIEAHKFS